MSAAAILLATALSGLFQLEGRDGRPSPGGLQVAELQLDGTLRGEERAEDASFSFAYEPRLLLAEGRSLDSLHKGSVSLALLPSRDVSVALQEQASYGRQDLSPLMATGTAIPIVALPIRFANTIGTTTSLKLADLVSRRLRWSATASYLWGGGISALERTYLPQTRQPALSADASLALTRTDQLGAMGEARASSGDNGAKSNLANLSLSLAHTFSRSTSATGGAGLGWTWTRLSPSAQAVWALLPTFNASLRSEEPIRGQRLFGALRANVAPTLDQLTGTAYTRADLASDLGWELKNAVSVALSGSYSYVVQGTLAGSRTVQGEARVTVPLREGLRLSAALRAADLRPRGPGSLGAGSQWNSLVQLAWDWQERL